MNKWLLWALFCFLPMILHGKTIIKNTGDTLNYLIPQDTIFLSTDSYSQKVFTHVMEPNQTLYSLSLFYGMTLDELYFYNPKNEGGRYEVGSKIKIPIPNRSILRFKPADYQDSLYVPIFYTVKRGETLFNIAHRVFNLPVDTIMNRNLMLTPSLYVGQKLHVGWMSIKGIPKKYRPLSASPIWQKSYTLKKIYLRNKKGKREYSRKGSAVYIKGAKSTSDLFVMHRYAPVGSIIAVTNLMKKRTVYAKVVAKIPASYDSNVEVVVSPRIGKMLGVRDPKFYVRTKYLK